MLTLEKPREMLARHVREGRARIAAQEALIVHLDMCGFMNVVPNALLLLGEMHRYQRRLETQLAQEKAREQRHRVGHLSFYGPALAPPDTVATPGAQLEGTGAAIKT